MRLPESQFLNVITSNAGTSGVLTAIKPGYILA